MWFCSFCSGGFIADFEGESIAEIAPAIDREDWDIEINCPNDGTTMRLFSAGDSKIDVCPLCSSMWLDGDEVEKLLSTKISTENSNDSQTTKVSQGGLSEADVLSPLIYAALDALDGGL